MERVEGLDVMRPTDGACAPAPMHAMPELLSCRPGKADTERTKPGLAVEVTVDAVPLRRDRCLPRAWCCDDERVRRRRGRGTALFSCQWKESRHRRLPRSCRGSRASRGSGRARLPARPLQVAGRAQLRVECELAFAAPPCVTEYLVHRFRGQGGGRFKTQRSECRPHGLHIPRRDSGLERGCAKEAPHDVRIPACQPRGRGKFLTGALIRSVRMATRLTIS